MNFLSFFTDFSSLLPVLLAFGVIFVNGFTDAPNAIASAVCSGVLDIKKACTMCAIFNFLGVFIISLITVSVAENIFSLADFGKNSNGAVCACFLSIILFGLISWYLGMPSSESHAIVASLSGATLASCGTIPNLKLLFQIIFFMIVSCLTSFCLSYISSKLFSKRLNYEKAEIVSCLFTSFMHGAQDGQKFLGILLYLFGAKKCSYPIFIPVILVALTMGIGTLFGGNRIIKSIGEDIIKLDTRKAYISDFSSGICMLVCSLFGLPVSTGNIKSCSIIGVGYAENDKINKRTAINILAVSIITFPVCFLMGYVFTSIFKF